MRVDRPSVLKRAIAIDALRPPADPELEQFLMTPPSMLEQVTVLSRVLQEHEVHRIVLIGDDDHMAPLLAATFGATIDVYEIDDRVIRSIEEVSRAWNTFVTVFKYDVREKFPNPGKYDFFYVNPPYSSHTNGLGIKVWLTRALEACVDKARGVLVMPGSGDLEWTKSNLLEVQRFLVENGCVVTGIEVDQHTYEKTHDVALMSTDFFIERVDSSISHPVANIDQHTRIYR